MKQLMTVLQFEYMTFVKGKMFIVSTIIMVIAGLILPAVPSFGGMLSGGIMGTEEGAVIAVADASGLFPKEKFSEYLSDYEFIDYTGGAGARAALESGADDIAVEIREDLSFTLYVSVMKISYYAILSEIDSMVRREYRMAKLGEAGLAPEDAGGILDFNPQGRIEAVSAPDAGDAENYQENMVYAYAMLFLLYFGLLMFGQYILTSVIREKTTKTMELLITSCKPSSLIHGKVFGVGLASLTQLLLLGAAAVVSMNFNASINAGAEDILIVAVKPVIIACMFIFFLLGFFAFGYIYAALGSTVSRMEDANSASVFPMMLIIVAFFGAMAGLLNPGASWVTVMSYIPFISPMVMFMRVCLGTATLAEAAAAGGIQLLAIVFTGWLGGHIYRMGTLMYGKKLNVKDIIAAVKQ